MVNTFVMGSKQLHYQAKMSDYDPKLAEKRTYQHLNYHKSYRIIKIIIKKNYFRFFQGQK